MRRIVLIAGMFTIATAHAQQPSPTPMGTVPTRDALVTGGLEVRGDSARLLTNASVTAYDRTATISLDRGGDALVCSTSQFHLVRSGSEGSLLFGLDRGAIELHTASEPQDVILTPDIRFTVEHPGHYNLRLRVTPNGDTCVDNAGSAAPVLNLADAFSTAQYRLIPGQHVLFEHGSLREVVDNERSPCGCPPTASYPSQMTLAAPQSSPGQPAASQTSTEQRTAAQPAPGQSTSAAQAAAQNPFPAAASQGLAPANPIDNSEPAGEKHTQISSTLSYDAVHPTPPPAAPATESPAETAASTATAAPASETSAPQPHRRRKQKKVKAERSTPPPSPPGADDLLHLIGRFFHKLFHPNS